MKLTLDFFNDIRELIVSARNTVARGVDLVQVHTNFEIGRRIVEQEQRGRNRADYGAEIVKALAGRLTDEFGKGFSASNLAYMRTFFLLYQDRASIFQTASGKLSSGKKLQSLIAKSSSAQKGQLLTDQFPIAQTVSGQSASFHQHRPFALSWTHYVFLLGVKNPDERRPLLAPQGPNIIAQGKRSACCAPPWVWHRRIFNGLKGQHHSRALCCAFSAQGPRAAPTQGGMRPSPHLPWAMIFCPLRGKAQHGPDPQWTPDNGQWTMRAASSISIIHCQLSIGVRGLL